MVGGCSFFQMGYVVNDIDRAIADFTDRYGAQLKDVIRDMRDSNGQPVLIQNLSHMMLGTVEIELIEPRRDWPSVYTMEAPVPGQIATLHHLGFLAKNDQQWDDVMGWVKQSNIPIAWSAQVPGVRFAYLDVQKQFGQYIEIVQRPGEINSIDCAIASPID